MARYNKQKINHLLEVTPKDTLLTMKCLKEHGLSNKLAWWYTKSEWLKHIADGIYCFSGSKIDWASAIAALQNQLDLALYPGAKAAFEICYLVLNVITFSEAALLIENLSRMRPIRLQSLFEACESYKVKYLPLYLADYDEHQWLSDIDLSKIDLGKGLQG